MYKGYKGSWSEGALSCLGNLVGWVARSEGWEMST